MNYKKTLLVSAAALTLGIASYGCFFRTRKNEDYQIETQKPKKEINPLYKQQLDFLIEALKANPELAEYGLEKALEDENIRKNVIDIFKRIPNKDKLISEAFGNLSDEEKSEIVNAIAKNELKETKNYFNSGEWKKDFRDLEKRMKEKWNNFFRRDEK